APGAALGPADPPNTDAVAHRAPVRNPGVAAPTGGAAPHPTAAGPAREDGPLALGHAVAPLVWAWQNAFVERSVGSARRECFDHVIVFNESGVRTLMTRYCLYYENTRTHLALHKDAPTSRPVMPPGDGAIIAIPEVGGLHHRYERRAA